MINMQNASIDNSKLIRVSKETYQRLRDLGQFGEDSYNSIIKKLLDKNK
jgi:predicted CopG family antitoxin